MTELSPPARHEELERNHRAALDRQRSAAALAEQRTKAA